MTKGADESQWAVRDTALDLEARRELAERLSGLSAEEAANIWTAEVVAPGAKRTQKVQNGVDLRSGVGSYAAVFTMGTGMIDLAIGLRPHAIRMACQRLRARGAQPMVAVDYLGASQIGTEEMCLAFEEIVQDCIDEGVMLVGGETAVMRDMYRLGAVDVSVTVLGRPLG